MFGASLLVALAWPRLGLAQCEASVESCGPSLIQFKVTHGRSLAGALSASTTHGRAAVQLANADFAEGTVFLDSPGVYTLKEDIVFDPKTPLSSGISDADSHFPDPASSTYPQLGGFFLGFFATIAIVADDVVLDCQGYSIEMSEDFHKRQRFHSLIELGSKPFISAAGPPQFANGNLSPGEPSVANNVTIKNCQLGLSSHHGIHGNENRGVKIQNLEISDFEVAGIHLNGAQDIHIEDVNIGPSLTETFGAHLSQVIFLEHLMNTLLPSQPQISALRNNATITLRGQEQTVGSIFRTLHDALHRFFAGDGSDLEAIVGSGNALPDGSLVSGVVIHTTGPAVNDFGACPIAKALAADKMVSGVSMKNVDIHDLAVDVMQVTRLMVDGKQVMGPAGDVFDWRMNTDSENKYIGNLLSDAQIAVGAFKKYLQAQTNLDEAALGWYFGGVHIPDSIIAWAAGGEAWSGQGEFWCNGDSMSHVNKGAVGLFLNYLEDGAFENVRVWEVANKGTVDSHSGRCIKPDYQGGDVRGVAIINSPALENEASQGGFAVDLSSLRAGSGGAVHGIDVIST